MNNRKCKIKPRKNIKAWEQPFVWTPKRSCSECDGTGMYRREYINNSLVDWDDCDRCRGTGEEPKNED